MMFWEGTEWSTETLSSRAARLDGEILGMEVHIRTHDDGRVHWTVHVGVELIVETPFGEDSIEETAEFTGWLDHGNNVVLAEVWDAVEQAIESRWRAAA